MESEQVFNLYVIIGSAEDEARAALKDGARDR